MQVKTIYNPIFFWPNRVNSLSNLQERVTSIQKPIFAFIISVRTSPCLLMASIRSSKAQGLSTALMNSQKILTVINNLKLSLRGFKK